MMKVGNSVQLHEAEIQEELHKDSSEDSDMVDTGAEEHLIKWLLLMWWGPTRLIISP